MVIDAIQLMDEKKVGALPVVDNGALVGIVSERDYTRKVILKGKSSKETPVGDIMTKQPLTVNASDRPLTVLCEFLETRRNRRSQELPEFRSCRMRLVLVLVVVLVLVLENHDV
jgi:CBS domain-containing protein